MQNCRKLTESAVLHFPAPLFRPSFFRPAIFCALLFDHICSWLLVCTHAHARANSDIIHNHLVRLDEVITHYYYYYYYTGKD